MKKINLTPAATVLVLRDTDDGIEVFLVKRSARPPFGNLFVFPGGKIDQDDSEKNIADLCEGIDDVQASESLGIGSGGLAYWVACVRECFEEVGILLAKKRDGSLLDLNGAEKEKYTNYREMLLKNEISLYKICEGEGLVLTTDNLAPFSHWITPEIEERRFDTWFFIARLPDNQTGEHDGSELTDSLWINPKEALKKAFNGDIQMIMPTIKNLQQCENYDSASKLLEDQKKLTSDDIPAILPKFFKKDGNWVGLLPDDPDYKNH